MLKSLSPAFRTALRHFLAFWTTPTPTPQKPLHEIMELMRAVDEAAARNDCKSVGQARRRLREARNAGLSREIANMLRVQLHDQGITK